MSECPICGSTNIRERFDLYDDRYGYPGKFRLLACRACRHAYLGNINFSDENIQRLYSDYYPRRAMRLEDYCPHVERTGLAAWLDGTRASAFRWVPTGARVLDIGCGFCQTLGYHAARGCEVWGVESDENARRVAEHYGFNVRIGVFKSTDFPNDYFDYVTMDQVIEHLRDPVEALKAVRIVLRSGGAAILSTPNARGWGARLFGRRWINWHAPYHLHFFSRRSMEVAAERAGLQVRRLGTITPSEWLRYQWIHLMTHPVMGSVSPFWSRSADCQLRDQFARRVASVLHRLWIDHLITRVCDGIGIGDSQIFSLTKS